MKRVAFTLIGGANWTGGYNYLLNLVTALSIQPKNPVICVLFFGDDVEHEYIEPFRKLPYTEIVRSKFINKSRQKISLIYALLIGRDPKVYQLFRTHNIDVVFEAAHFHGWRGGIASVVWIPDFQHKLLPKMFSKSSLFGRELRQQIQFFGKGIIMLSSNDAKQTCEHLYPSTIGKTEVVHFSIVPNNAIDSTQARVVADLYNLPKQYFFLPNQFWTHKNHHLVLDALIVLRQKGKNIVIVSSGKQNDNRSPNYFQGFKKKLELESLAESFLLLGLIPYHHIVQLMSASIALINPSLFEGWSTTVEEARSIGVPMILSDLGVHREQMGVDAQYFDPFSAESLAGVLEKFQPLTIIQREIKAQNAKNNSMKLVSKFSSDFVNTVERSYFYFNN